ncbi:hypothetical protein CSC2_22470 [Clostridium zeae]|uniref:Zinc ribbon domain-containing protein n=1 Tax=Clostridium zeae TaxID=2759022 RepID=A0ABQ1EAE3_9CLOT|nr:hypothetical protein [Clostridium zeae]GFZ31721.1 hypothetical protein CSC2_22470 [Clostridium zeae]
MKVDDKTQWESFERLGKGTYISISMILTILVVFGRDIFSLLSGKVSFSTIHFSKLVEIGLFILLSYIFSICNWSSKRRAAERQIRKEQNIKPKIEYCYYCGSKLDDNNNTCSHCKNKLDL